MIAMILRNPKMLSIRMNKNTGGFARDAGIVLALPSLAAHLIVQPSAPIAVAAAIDSVSDLG